MKENKKNLGSVDLKTWILDLGTYKYTEEDKRWLAYVKTMRRKSFIHGLFVGLLLAGIVALAIR